MANRPDAAPAREHSARAYVLLILMVLIWGANFSVAKVALDSVPPLALRPALPLRRARRLHRASPARADPMACAAGHLAHRRRGAARERALPAVLHFRAGRHRGGHRRRTACRLTNSHRSALRRSR